MKKNSKPCGKKKNPNLFEKTKPFWKNSSEKKKTFNKKKNALEKNTLWLQKKKFDIETNQAPLKKKTNFFLFSIEQKLWKNKNIDFFFFKKKNFSNKTKTFEKKFFFKKNENPKKIWKKKKNIKTFKIQTNSQAKKKKHRMK